MRTTITRATRCITARRFWFPVGAFVLALLVFGLQPQVAFAQGVDDPMGPFQLEGNTAVDTDICFELSATGALLAPFTGSCSAPFVHVHFASNDDWDHVFLGTSISKVTSFVGPTTCFPQPCINELFNTTNDDNFTGGGSKDIHGVSSWAWNNSKAQGKDDIEDAFAAVETLPNGHTAIFFGLDRFDNSGDSTAGFWFFQDSTVAQATSTCTVNSGCPFSGHHSDGDILIVSDFSTGGPVASIAVFQWSCPSLSGSACDTSGSLSGPLTVMNEGECNPSAPGKDLCAIVNGSASKTTVTSTPAWTFADKSGNSGYLEGEFLEGGIDLEAVFGANVPCITRFMAETRASTKPDSTLSDFTPPVSFSLCGISITKKCPNGSVSANATTGGRNFTYGANGTITNTGIGTLFNVVVTDTPEGVGGTALTDLENTSGGSLTAPVTAFTLANFPAKDASNNPNCIRWPSGDPCTSANAPTFFQFETNTNGPLNSASVTAFTNSALTNQISATSDDNPSVPGNQPAMCPTLAINGTLGLTKTCGTTCLVVGSSGDIVRVNYTGSVCNNSTSSVATFTGVTVTDVNAGSVSGSESMTITWPDPMNPGVLPPNVNGNTNCATITGSYEPSTAPDAGFDFDDHLHGSASCALCTNGTTQTQDSGVVDCPVCPAAGLTKCP